MLILQFNFFRTHPSLQLFNPLGDEDKQFQDDSCFGVAWNHLGTYHRLIEVYHLLPEHITNNLSCWTYPLKNYVKSISIQSMKDLMYHLARCINTQYELHILISTISFKNCT